VALYHEVAGEGKTVVLLHAGVGDSRMWNGQWDAFRRRYRTVRCDLRGWGRSPIEPGSFSNARDVIELCEQLGVERAVFVGVSMGGQVALEIAVARPELVSALVLAGASLPEHEWSAPVRAVQHEEEAALERGDTDAVIDANMRLWVAGLRRNVDEVDPDVRALVAEMLGRAIANWMPVLESAEEEHLVPDLGARLGKIACPALVLVGELDVTDIHELADVIDRGIPRTRRATIDGAAHLPQLERPEEFNRLVLDFLAEALGSPPSLLGSVSQPVDDDELIAPIEDAWDAER
jgi:pimeloyl-ACP methyl ester carboxylesterase